MRQFTVRKFLWLLSVLIVPLTVWGVGKFDAAVYTDWLKIGGTADANSKSALDIVSTTKGVLLPRMTETQRDAITSPPTALMVYNTTTNKYNVYNGSAWGAVGGDFTGPGSSTDNAVVLWNGTGGATVKNSSVTVSGSAITGSLTGNASTSTALAANPSACASDRYVTDTAANGDLTCAQVTNAGLAGSIAAAKLIGTDIATVGTITSGTWNGTAIDIPRGGTNNSGLSVALGTVFYGDGSRIASLAPGTSGQVLTSGGSAAPSWVSGGSGGTNEQSEYITNGKFEVDTTGWATYADAAATSPVNCTGGSPVTTIAQETSTPIKGVGSFKFLKDSSNRQGEGFSYDFTIDPQDYKNLAPIYISFPYKASSQFVSGDIIVSVYDKDSSTLLSVQDVSNLSGALPSSLNGTLFTGVFYPTTNTSNDYRLCFHVATTSALDYNFYVDNVHAGPQVFVPGAIVTDLGSESWTDSEANSTTSVKLSRDGEWIFVEGISTASGVFSGSQFLVTIPAAYTPDVAIYPAPATKVHMIGRAEFVNNANSTYLQGSVNLVGANSFYISADGTASTYANPVNLTSTIPFTWASGDKIMWFAKWRVTGWLASASLSANEMVMSTVKARYTSNAAQSYTTGAANILDFEDKVFDNYSAVTTGASWKFTAPKTAIYEVRASILWASSGAWAVNETHNINVYKNGAAYASRQDSAHGTLSTFVGDSINTTVSLTKGEYIDIRPSQGSGSTIAIHNDGAYVFVDIEEMPDFDVFSTFQRIPTFQKFTSGTTQTYTTPPGVKLIKIRMVGGGGKGGGGGQVSTTATNGSNGNDTVFGSLTAGGGAGGGTAGGAVSAGGTNTFSGTGFEIPGGAGGGEGLATLNTSRHTGGYGGNSIFGGGGASSYNQAGSAGATNSGGGGGGGGEEGTGGTFVAGGGGGSGGYVEAWITNPAATYTYTVGAAQSGGGAAGTTGFGGGNGAAGIILVDEY